MADLRLAKKCKNTMFTVLCGHSHSSAEFTPLPNLHVMCGAARYKHPTVKVIKLGGETWLTNMN